MIRSGAPTVRVPLEWRVPLAACSVSPEKDNHWIPDVPSLMPFIRRLIRIPLLSVHVVLGVLVINLCVMFDRVTRRPLHQGVARQAQVFWCHSICLLMGVRIRRSGQPMQQPPVLIACNHVSWLDILVVAASWEVSFLSKSEVRHWPGVGAVATGLGTLYIERGKRDASLQTIRLMSDRLQENSRVLFFPEGTTNGGETLLPFRPRLFQSAMNAGVPVQPLTIRYVRRRDGRVCDAAPFVDQQPLLSHVIRLAGEPGIDALLTVGEPVPSEGCSRNQLALLMREQMAVMFVSLDDQSGGRSC